MNARARASYLLLCLCAEMYSTEDSEKHIPICAATKYSPILPASLQLSITEFEVPHVVKLGESAELKCRYELLDVESKMEHFVKWWRTSLDSGDDRIQLYQRLSGRPAVPIHHKDIVIEIKDHDTIVLPNVTAADSKTYECEVSNIDEVRKHANLIVYTEGTGPQLNVTEVEDGPDEDQVEDGSAADRVEDGPGEDRVEDGSDEDQEEYVLIGCTARDVAPAPDFILTINSEELELTKNIEGPDEQGLYNITGNVSVSIKQFDQMEIRCELIYLNPNISHPPYVDFLLYNSSGEITSTELPGNETDTEAPLDSQESGHGCNLNTSWFLLVFVGLLTSLRI